MRNCIKHKGLQTYLDCGQCKKTKRWEEFGKSKKAANGKVGICKVCACKNSRKNYKTNKDKKWFITKRLQLVLRKYNMTVDDWDRRLTLQKGTCGICGKKEDKIGKYKRTRLSVDHNHNTGQIRGLLCGNCNKGIGYLGDSLEILRKAQQYMSSDCQAINSKGQSVDNNLMEREIRGRRKKLQSLLENWNEIYYEWLFDKCEKNAEAIIEYTDKGALASEICETLEVDGNTCSWVLVHLALALCPELEEAMIEEVKGHVASCAKKKKVLA